MIVEAIFKFFVNGLLGLLALLPTADHDILTSWNSVKETLLEILRGVTLLIPFDELTPIIYFQAGLWAFKLVYAAILRIKSFIPTIGGT